MLKNTSFSGLEDDVALTMIDESRERAGDFAILSLWAVLERSLLEFVRMEGRRILRESRNEFMTNVYRKIDSEMEYWKSMDMLDLFIPVAGGDLIGKAKQIKQYRDWIAHRNPNKPKPPNVTPESAYKILSGIVEAAERNLAASQQPHSA